MLKSIITRTIITGYKYDVMERKDATIKIVGQVVVDKRIRSVKKQQEILVANGFNPDCTLIKNCVTEKKYQISEEDFIKHAVEVVETTPEVETEVIKTENK